jgi:hypothetical protein
LPDLHELEVDLRRNMMNTGKSMEKSKGKTLCWTRSTPSTPEITSSTLDASISNNTNKNKDTKVIHPTL